MTVILSIIALQITYVTMLSVRFILMVKGIRYVAAMMSAVEIGIYVIGFKLVLDNLNNPLNLLIYCLSYGAGVLLGVKIEERLAIGYITVQITTKEEYGDLADRLRAKGYGVTRWAGDGREGRRWVHNVVLPRRRQQMLYRDAIEIDPSCFIVSYEPKAFHGGFMTRKM